MKIAPRKCLVIIFQLSFFMLLFWFGLCLYVAETEPTFHSVQLLSVRACKHRLVKQVLRRLLKKKGRGELCRQYSPHKNCPYQEFFWFVFSRIRTEYGDLKSKFRIRENTNQKTPNLDDFYAVTCSAEAKKVFFFFSTLKLC